MNLKLIIRRLATDCHDRTSAIVSEAARTPERGCNRDESLPCTPQCRQHRPPLWFHRVHKPCNLNRIQRIPMPSVEVLNYAEASGRVAPEPSCAHVNNHDSGPVKHSAGKAE